MSWKFYEWLIIYQKQAACFIFSLILLIQTSKVHAVMFNGPSWHNDRWTKCDEIHRGYIAVSFDKHFPLCVITGSKLGWRIFCSNLEARAHR